VPLGDGQGVGGFRDGEPLAELGIDELTRAVLRDGVHDVAPAIHRIGEVGGRRRERREPLHERVGRTRQGIGQLGRREQRVGVQLTTQDQQTEAHVALHAVARPSPVRTMRPACSRESSMRFRVLRAIPVSRRSSPDDLGRWSRRTT